MAGQPEELFKAVDAVLKAASAAERGVAAADAAASSGGGSRPEEAIRMYTKALQLLDEARSSGGHPPQISAAMEKKAQQIESRIQVIRRRVQGVSERSLAVSGAVESGAPDPFKASVAVIHSAVEADAKFKAGDKPQGATAVEMYTEGLRLLEQALGSGTYNHQVQALLSQKEREIRGRLEILGPLVAAVNAGTVVDEGVPPAEAVATDQAARSTPTEDGAKMQSLQDEVQQLREELHASKERERHGLEAMHAHASEMSATRRHFDEMVAAKQAAHEEALRAERARGDAELAATRLEIAALQTQLEQTSQVRVTLQATEATMYMRILASTAQQRGMRSKTRSIHAWRELLTRKVALRNRMGKAVVRIRHLVIYSALAKWIGFVARARRLLTAAVRTMERCRRRQLHAAFSQWTRRALDRRRRRGLRLLVVQRLQHRWASIVFDLWADVIAQDVQQRRRVEELSVFHNDVEQANARLKQSEQAAQELQAAAERSHYESEQASEAMKQSLESSRTEATELQAQRSQLAKLAAESSADVEKLQQEVEALATTRDALARKDERVRDLEFMVNALREEAVVALPARLERILAAAKQLAKAMQHQAEAEKLGIKVAELRRLKDSLTGRIREHQAAAERRADVVASVSMPALTGVFESIDEEGSLPALVHELDATTKEIQLLENEQLYLRANEIENQVPNDTTVLRSAEDLSGVRTHGDRAAAGRDEVHAAIVADMCVHDTAHTNEIARAIADANSAVLRACSAEAARATAEKEQLRSTIQALYQEHKRVVLGHRQAIQDAEREIMESTEEDYQVREEERQAEHRAEISSLEEKVARLEQREEETRFLRVPEELAQQHRAAIERCEKAIATCKISEETTETAILEIDAKLIRTESEQQAASQQEQQARLALHEERVRTAETLDAMKASWARKLQDVETKHMEELSAKVQQAQKAAFELFDSERRQTERSLNTEHRAAIQTCEQAIAACEAQEAQREDDLEAAIRGIANEQARRQQLESELENERKLRKYTEGLLREEQDARAELLSTDAAFMEALSRTQGGVLEELDTLAFDAEINELMVVKAEAHASAALVSMYATENAQLQDELANRSVDSRVACIDRIEAEVDEASEREHDTCDEITAIAAAAASAAALQLNELELARASEELERFKEMLSSSAKEAQDLRAQLADAKFSIQQVAVQNEVGGDRFEGITLAASMETISAEQRPLGASPLSLPHVSARTVATADQILNDFDSLDLDAMEAALGGEYVASAAGGHTTPLESSYAQTFVLPPCTGRLKANVVRCTHVLPADKNGKSDVFVTLRLGSNRQQKTTVQSRTLDPQFDETFDLSLDVPSASKQADWSSESLSLVVEVWDRDRGSSNDFLGQTIVSLGSLFAKAGSWVDNEVTECFALSDPEGRARDKTQGQELAKRRAAGDERPYGTIELRLSFSPDQAAEIEDARRMTPARDTDEDEDASANSE